MTRPTFYVRIVRDDGSMTYKGAWSETRAEREASAWREHFPAYAVGLVPAADPAARAKVREWSRAVADGRRFYPAEAVR